MLEQMRAWVEPNDALAELGLYTIIYFQGVDACVAARTRTASCAGARARASSRSPRPPSTPIPTGSRLAIRHFTEYLEQFPDDLEVRWLLNLAHMTLGEYPHKVDPRYLISPGSISSSPSSTSASSATSATWSGSTGSTAGGAIMEDFDNDGLLDLATTSFDPDRADGLSTATRATAPSRSAPRRPAAGQLGGLVLRADRLQQRRPHGPLHLARGLAPAAHAARPCCGTTATALSPTSPRKRGCSARSIPRPPRWADYDNDGWLDLFVVCEQQSNRLYHNRGDGTFEEVAAKAGVQQDAALCKGAAWIDYDNDDYPDLFVDNLQGDARLYHNNRDGTFTDVTEPWASTGPRRASRAGPGTTTTTAGSTSSPPATTDARGRRQGDDRQTAHALSQPALPQHRAANDFKDKTKEAGLDMVFATMGSNFGDFDNDGFLDLYLGTGDPTWTLVPNRMFKNVAGRRFAEITASSRDGPPPERAWRRLRRLGPRRRHRHLHRDGRGRQRRQVPQRPLPEPRPGQPLADGEARRQEDQPRGDRRPDQGGHRRREAVDGPPARLLGQQLRGQPAGANTSAWPRRRKVASLEVHWPTSGTTQVFRDIDADQAIEITEFATDYRKLDWKPIRTPTE